jgi:hypothetical protein
MLRNVTLRFGAAPGEPPLSFSPGPMTVFVGPNNSGKSLALRELEALIESGDPSLLHIVRAITPHLPDAQTVERMVRSREVEGEPVDDGWVRVLRLMARDEEGGKRATDLLESPRAHLVNLAALRAAVEHGGALSGEELRMVSREFLSLLRSAWTGRRASPSRSRGWRATCRPSREPPGRPLQDDAARERIRQITRMRWGCTSPSTPREARASASACRSARRWTWRRSRRWTTAPAPSTAARTTSPP